jgi:drug/metabolite transporter (DMT)-like permease
MSPGILALLLVAAALHAGWNLLLKQARETHAVTWWALAASSAVIVPLYLLGPPLPAAALPFALASAAAEAVYFVLLASAYRLADFSLVYPLARGAAPLLLAAGAVAFLGERPSHAGVAGLALLVGGLVTVGLGAPRREGAARPASAKGIAAAAGVAACIGLYSAIDAAAVRRFPLVPYATLILGLTALFVTPVVLARYGGRRLMGELRQNRARIAVAAPLMLLSYALVLAAYAVAPVTYAGAVREVSIVFAALAGRFLLGEGFARARLAGSVLIFAGILTIAIAG